MPRVQEESRVRARRPKTGGGCRTCKARKVKCDEAKPFCRNCTSKGRKCAGYEDSPLDLQRLTIIAALADVKFENNKEGRAFDFFQHRTCRQLTGNYQRESFIRMVVQLARADSGIRHAAVALASIHESFRTTCTPGIIFDGFAFQQYDTAIRQHVACLGQSKSSEQDLGCHIVACILFICIEIIQFHYQSAASLIQQGVHLLNILFAKKSTVSVWPLDVFERFIYRLQGQSMAVVDSSGFKEMTAPRIEPPTFPRILPKFETVAQAREHFELYRTSYDMTHWRGGSSMLSREKRLEVFDSYSQVMMQYSPSLDEFEVRVGDTLDRQDRRSLALLKIRRRFWLTWQDITREPPAIRKHLEDAWDSRKEILEEILDLSSTAMSLQAGERSNSNPAPTLNYGFTLDIGVVSPLSDVARICRDPVLRRRAIHLLRLRPSREGLADSMLSARVCERIMELEEAGAPGDIKSAVDVPSYARIRKVVPRGHSAHGVNITYYRDGVSNPHTDYISI